MPGKEIKTGEDGKVYSSLFILQFILLYDANPKMFNGKID